MDGKIENDYELLSYIQEHSEEAMELLIQKYRPLVVSAAGRLYRYCKNNGVELSDLIQEGMLGLNQAIMNYDQNRDAGFATYAKTCVERSVISFALSTQRLKNKILNESISFEFSNSEEENFTLDKFLLDNTFNPEEVVMDHDWETRALETVSKNLTDFEKQVFDLKLSGFGYREIADILERDPKAIDNAIQRIRTKVKDYIKKD